MRAWLLACTSFVLTACNGVTASKTITPLPTTRVIRSDYQKGEIQVLCNQAIQEADTKFKAIAAIAPDKRTIDNTLLALENAQANLEDATEPIGFMRLVSPDKSIRADAADCKSQTTAFDVEVSARRELYNAVKDQKARNAGEARLLYRTLQGFEQNGLKLPDDQLAQVKDLNARLERLKIDFETNLNEDTSTVTYTPEELDGANPDFIKGLAKTQDGKLIVTTKEPDYAEVMQEVKSDDARYRMQLAYLNRAADANTKLLEEAVQVREQIAKILGFPTWAAYRIQPYMAGSADNVMNFLNRLKAKLAAKNRQDLDQLLAYKKELDPKAIKVNQWDQAYLAYQLQKRDYQLDDDQVSEYFPADVVISGMFNVYSKMLGVRYQEVPNAKVWAQGVKLYEIHDQSDNRLIGYFYTDFYPRPGKYGHAAAFPLISARMLPKGYSKPVAAIVANLRAAAPGKPPLLPHGDVITIFHEFGHIMHATLTRAPFASLSGMNVAMDFVEAPSQMLENWPWQQEVLEQLSGHYLDHSRKLPKDILDKMLAVRGNQQGRFYMRQLLLALFDMTIHSQTGPVDVTQTFDDLYRTVVGDEPITGTHFAASFGHIMGGYDAGYYGYLWSKVYAEDMFTVFQAGGVTSPVTGSKYRKDILERGDMVDAINLLRDFLGREPNSDAFFKRLHIEPSEPGLEAAGPGGN